MKTYPVISRFWLTTWPFLALFPVLSLSSRGINVNFLFLLSLPYLFIKLTLWIWWRFRVCSLIIRLFTFPKSLRLGPGRIIFTILLVRFSYLDKSISAKSWKLLFRHVCKRGCSCCFWLEHTFSLTKCVGESNCNTGKLSEWISFSVSAMFKRNNNNN